MIGVFDSGAGGLTVLKAIETALPGYDIAYFGDTARYPYGNQSAEQLRRYAKEDAALLLGQGASMLVVACNSASAAASDELRAAVSVPVFDVIGPAIAAALRVSRGGNIGIIGTKATVQSRVYERLLAGRARSVYALATPMLVPLVEERWWKHPESMRIIRRSLAPLKRQHIDTLILGCTHYPLLEPLIRRVMGKRIALVNPAEATAAALAAYCVEHPTVAASLSKTGSTTFFVSSDPEHFAVTTRWWLGRPVNVTEAKTVSES